MWSTASLLSLAAAASPMGSTALVQGGGWLLCVAALNSLCNTGHPQSILPKRKMKTWTMSIAKGFWGLFFLFVSCFFFKIPTHTLFPCS